MATDTDVQFFSHLNGLTLGNNWGDLIRLLDKALVTGIDFTQITAVSISDQGDVHITLYAAHNAMLFQVVELSGFTPSSLNQRYRIKGVPNTTQLILKPALDIAERTITTIGAGKLASLGYEIIFRDANDVKRVYRAKNPTVQHPFIRVDETISDGVNSYTSTYAKSAMVGLLENMTHIDDYQNPDVLQLPFDPADLSKNWKITGNGSNVVKGWMRWHYASALSNESNTPNNGNRSFSIFGDKDSFYLQLAYDPNNPAFSYLYGAGMYTKSLIDNVIPSWYLMGYLSTSAASNIILSGARTNNVGSTPLMGSANSSSFFVPKSLPAQKLSGHSIANIITPDYNSGNNSLTPSSNHPALEIPFYADGFLLGNLKHIAWLGKTYKPNACTPIISGSSLYICFPVISLSNPASLTAYLGELYS